ncbi:single-stranded DNA-binding protein [Cohnella faecalis]|uniref:Single-stranded DNA-binding protein n=1 Tax=Cohnella faecalis TaxID=2315694 RepID=A0A398CL76_9BACL|nr:single-stranded DNA-binding protein [Cohnella faecalis]RIE03010.1 hypothetical protein D3H35_20660 [Cohnella faecalis]
MEANPQNSFINHVELTGTLLHIPIQPKMTTVPIYNMSFQTIRPKGIIDQLDLVLFGNDQFHKQFKIGDRIRLEGFIQSNNYDKKGYKVEPLHQAAVENYYELFGEYPSDIVPTYNKTSIINWNKLLNAGLVPAIPDDSMYVSQSIKRRGADMKSVYSLNEHRTVTKSTFHINYQVVIQQYRHEDQPPHPLKGDLNRVHMQGKVDQVLYYNPAYGPRKVPFLSLRVFVNAYGVQSFIHVVCWNQLAQSHQSLKKGDIVWLKGYLQSREYDKDVRTTNGKEKQVTAITREVNATDFKLLAQGDSSR